MIKKRRKEMSEDVKNKRKPIEMKGFSVLDLWLKNYREGKRIESFFVDNEYKNVAIYGMGRLGMHVLSELRGSSINIDYCIDKNSQLPIDEIVIVKPEYLNNMKETDAIIVTPIQYFNEIEKCLIEYGYDGDILSLAQIVDYIGRLS